MNPWGLVLWYLAAFLLGFAAGYFWPEVTVSYGEDDDDDELKPA